MARDEVLERIRGIFEEPCPECNDNNADALHQCPYLGAKSVEHPDCNCCSECTKQCEESR